MKAIIMAGGEGSRLRPLTCGCPKPMVPLMGRPVIEYAFELLKQHGITDVGVTLGYLPDKVMERYGEGGELDMSIRYYIEDAPLGTAGSVKQARDFLDETFVVLSGDGVTDCDLTSAINFHRERGALATLVLKRVENPLEYGVVITNVDGSIRRFVEKPTWGEVFSDTVNTGIYILEPEILDMIPAGRPHDFGRELFPSMVEAGLPIFAYVMSGYWCDIGDISAYLKAHIDIMDGRAGTDLPIKPGGVYRARSAKIDRSAVLEGPCYIGPGSVISGGARIGAYSVIGANCSLSGGASVKRAVLWDGVSMGARAQARGCVLQSNADMGRDSAAFEESVLGDGATLGEGGTIMPGVKVWPQKSIGGGCRVDANVVWGSSGREQFSSGRLKLTSPTQATRVAQAYCSVVRPDTVLMGRSSSPAALANYLAVESGLMAQGVQVVELGAVTPPQLRNLLNDARTDGAVLVSEEDLLPLDMNGADLPTDIQRKVEGAISRQDYARPFSGQVRLPVRTGRCDIFYTGKLAGSFPAPSGGESRPQYSIAVHAGDELLLGIAERAFEKAGYPIRAEWEDEMMELAPGELGIWLREGGECFRLADELGEISETAHQLLTAWCALEAGESHLILPVGATRAIEPLATDYGAEVIRVKGERAYIMKALASESRRQLSLWYDGLYAGMNIVYLLNEKRISLREWLERSPVINRAAKSIPISLGDKGRLLRALAEREENANLTDGISLNTDKGWVWIDPSGDRAELGVVSESADSETADELCGFYIDKIVKMMKPEGEVPS